MDPPADNFVAECYPQIGSGVELLANQTMTVLLTLIKSIKTSTVLEDAFLVLGAMAAGMKKYDAIDLY